MLGCVDLIVSINHFGYPHQFAPDRAPSGLRRLFHLEQTLGHVQHAGESDKKARARAGFKCSKPDYQEVLGSLRLLSVRIVSGQYSIGFIAKVPHLGLKLQPLKVLLSLLVAL